MSESVFAGLSGGWGGGHGIAATAKYNPHLWSADELRAIFVVRQRELATILDAIRAVPAGGVPQHMLITGQRGMGKSTLLQRVALAVNEDAKVKQTWLALRFPEEQYTVSTPGELWSNVVGALADALERQGLPIELIDAQLLKLGQMPMVAREEAALAWLAQWCEQHQKRLVLLMDNTDLLFTNLAGAAANKRGSSPDGGATALWRVRKVLQHSPHFFWLGGSYQPLEVSGLYSDAFLDFFQLIELRPLTLLEMQTAILALARTFGAGRGLGGDAAEEDVRRMLDARPERLRAMRQLTGGNPRTTITLYELFAAGGQESVRSDLERLLDAMTPLYKARLEILADQMRKILAHVMESWAPVTAKALADVSGIAVNMVSAQLLRLEQEGLVEKVSLSGKKRQGYQAAERFFNIWYLMRNAPRSARARVGWLVEFMRLWYSKEEMQDIAKSRWLEHRDGVHCDYSELEYSRALARAMPKAAQERQNLDWAVFRHARKSAALTDLFDLQGEDSDYSSPDDYLARLDKARDGLKAVQLEEPEKSAWVNEVISALHLTLGEKEELARSCCEMSVEKVSATRQALQKKRKDFIDFYGEEGIAQLAAAIGNGDFFPDCPDSRLALTQIETCFGLLPNAFLASVGRLVNRQKDEAVEVLCRKAIALVPQSARPWNSLGHFFENIAQNNDAEAAFRKAIEIDANWSRPWGNLGDLLQYKLGRYGEAEAAYRKAIELDAYWAQPWCNLGNLLQHRLDCYKEAETTYRKAIELDSNWAAPWRSLGHLLQYTLNRYEEAEAAYRKTIELDPRKVESWTGLGDLLKNKLLRYEEAEAAYRKAIELDANYAYPWVSLGNLLAKHLNRSADAENCYRTALKIDPKYVWAWECLGDFLRFKSGRYDEAEAAFRKGLEIDPANSGLWNDLGNLLLDQLKRPDEAESAFRMSIGSEKHAAGLANLGRLLVIQKRPAEAYECYKDAVAIAVPTANEVLFHSHCYLGNDDLAKQALDVLAEQASKGDHYAFFRLKEQCFEFHKMEMEQKMIAILERSTWSGFLQPFALALRAANGEKEALLDAPAEVRSLAEDILLQITS